MSLLADLLSKANNEVGEKNTAVPPQLKSIITRASDKKKRQTRLVILAAIVLLVIVTGFGIVYYMDRFVKPSGLVVKTAPGAVPPAPQAPPAAPAPEAAAPAAPAATPAHEPAAAQPPQKAVKPAAKTDAAVEELKETGHTTMAASPPIETKAAKPAASGAQSAVTVRDTGGQSPEKVKRATERKAPPSVAKEKPGKGAIEDRRKGDRDAALYAARSYEESGNLSQAIANYKKALQLDGKNCVIMASLSGALIKTGAYAESIQYSRFAVNTNRSYTPAIINLAIASIQLGDTREGEQNLLRARSLEPGNRNILYNLALLYEGQQRYGEARDVYEKLVTADIRQGLVGMGRVLEKQGKREEAKKVYRDILSSQTVDAQTKQYANERLVLLGN